MMKEDYIPSENEESSVEVTDSAPSWMLDDNTPGVGDRPEWLPEKFKTASDLSKSYKELEKKMMTPGPQDYDLSSARHIDPSFEAFENLKNVAKDNKVPQEVMDQFVSSVDSYLDQYQMNPEQEMEKLGPQGQQRLEVLENWIESSLDSDSANVLFEEIQTAKGIEALENLRNRIMENGSNIPSGNDVESESVGTIEDVHSELTQNIEKYKTDKKYQREIRQKLERFSQGSNFVDKQGQ